MAMDPPTRARVVIVGGGVIGCSVAYHLTKMGWNDIVLLERKQLTSGTTWHAAGLVGQLHQSINMTQLARYTGDLYRGLEAETGQATGYRQCGSLSPGDHARTHGGTETQCLHGEGIRPARERREPARDSLSLYPLAHLEDVIGGIHIPSDSYTQYRRYHSGARQGRPQPRRRDLPGPQSHRHPS